MPAIRVGDFDCHYSDLGDGPVWTLLHPACLDGRVWDSYLGLAKDRRLLIVDLRGHGGSSAGGGLLSLSQLADDVVALWEALGVSKSVVFGASLGGMVAQYLAHEHAEMVTGQVLLCTSYSLTEQARATIRMRGETSTAPEQAIDETLVRWFGAEPERWPQAAAYCRERLLSTPATVQQQTWGVIAGLSLPAGWVSGFPGETLALPGGADPTVPVQASIDFAGESGAAVRVIEDAPHMGVLTHPGAIRRAIEGFDRRLG